MENNKQMKLYSPGCMDNNRQMKLYYPVCMDNNRKMKLYYPLCMDNNRQMKLYYPVCMDNNRTQWSCITLCVWKIANKWSCIPLGVWKIRNKWRCVPLGVWTFVSLNSVLREILSSFIIDSYDKVRGGNKAQWWLLSVHLSFFILKYSTTGHNFIEHYFALHNNSQMKLYNPVCMDNNIQIKL